jgi:hypothetical protein
MRVEHGVSRSHLVLLSTLISLTAIAYITLVLQASLSVSLNFLALATPIRSQLADRTHSLTPTVSSSSPQRLLATAVHLRSLSLTVIPLSLLRPLSTAVHLRSRSHMQFRVGRCARSWRSNDCWGTCAHIQFRVVRNYANEQSVSRSMGVYGAAVCALLLSANIGFTLFIANVC